MIRTIGLLGAAVLLSAQPVLADSFTLKNDTGFTLGVQSRAVKFVVPLETKDRNFKLAAGENKKVDFGKDFRIWYADFKNADKPGQHAYHDFQPLHTNPERAWKIIISVGANGKLTADIQQTGK